MGPAAPFLFGLRIDSADLVWSPDKVNKYSHWNSIAILAELLFVRFVPIFISSSDQLSSDDGGMWNDQGEGTVCRFPLADSFAAP